MGVGKNKSWPWLTGRKFWDVMFLSSYDLINQLDKSKLFQSICNIIISNRKKMKFLYDIAEGSHKVL